MLWGSDAAGGVWIRGSVDQKECGPGSSVEQGECGPECWSELIALGQCRGVGAMFVHMCTNSSCQLPHNPFHRLIGV